MGDAAIGDFFLCDIWDASPKDDLGSMEHPMFSLSTRPDRTVRRYERGGVAVTVTPSVRGRATIHDKDVLIYCISQLMAALNAGRQVSRTLRLTAHDLLVATRRDTGGDAYARLREAFERLAGTRITTNMATGGLETTTGFGLIEGWEIVRKTRGGRMVSVTVTLSDWLFRAVLAKSVLTLHRDYFGLRKPLERRLYELARKHCGGQAQWTISLASLHQKAGSDAPLRVFRAAVRRTIAADPLPDYRLEERPGDLIGVVRKDAIGVVRKDAVLEPGPGGPGQGGPGSLGSLGPPLAAATMDAARALAPGADPYALEAEWRAFWVATGRPRLRAPDKAFLGWVRARPR